jgi:hypothetical protein
MPTTDHNLAAAIKDYVQSHHDWRKPIFDAVDQKRINLAYVYINSDPHAVAVAMKIGKRLPTIIIFGEDHNSIKEKGPQKCNFAETIREWADFFIVHGADGKKEHAYIALKASSHHKHVVIIETDSAHEKEWMEWFEDGDCKGLLITAVDGPHPIAIH